MIIIIRYFFSVFFFLLLSTNCFSQKKEKVRIVVNKQDTSFQGLLPFRKPSIDEDGFWNVLYINNKVKESFVIKNGQLQGKVIWYWPNGNKMYSGFFEEGQIIKKWLVFAPDGTLAKKFIYGKEEKIKKQIQYDQGKVVLVTIYDANGDEEKTIKK